MSDIQFQGITRIGTVTVKENAVIVSGFSFDGCGTSEALKWAIQQIEDALNLPYRIGESAAQLPLLALAND